MGFLEWAGLVEKVPDDTDYHSDMELDMNDYAEQKPDIDVDVENVDVHNVISEIYDKNGVSDTSRSIFKAEEVAGKLPKEMATVTKRNTVIQMLESFGISSEEVINDGNDRIELINAAYEKFFSESDTFVSLRSMQIEDHKKEIERLEKEISSKQEELKNISENVECETKRISNLIKFMTEE